MMADWQPIETAPKIEYEPVLLGRAASALQDAWVCIARWIEGAWYEDNNDPADSWGGPLCPTHWQPRPAPPQATP